MIGLIRVTFVSCVLFISLVFPFVHQSIADQHNSAAEIQQNIKKLQESNNCAQCDLSGADLTRMDLSDANLEGANLARAKMFLTNLSGANLKNSDLRGAMFGGADLGSTDMRGADLTGASLAGAYMAGALLDGEMVTTTPDKDEDIVAVEQTVYVDDTVKPKPLQEANDITIAPAHDSEITPPSDSLEIVQPEESSDKKEIVGENVEKATVPEKSLALPPSKKVPTIEKVTVQEKEDTSPVLFADDSKKQLSQETQVQAAPQEEKINVESLVDNQVVEVVSVTEPTVEPQKQENIPEPVAQNEATVVAPVQEEIVEIEAEEEKAVAPQTPEEVSELVTEEVEIDESQNRDELATSNPKMDGEGSGTLLEHNETVQMIAENPEATESGQSTISLEPVQSSPDPTEKVNEAPLAELPGETLEEEIKETVVETSEKESTGEPDEAIEVITEVLDSSSPMEPPSEILQNIEVLLDSNQCYGCNLAGADLSGENLDGADLEGADLSKANLKNSDLEEANLKGVNFTGADLTGADLSGADLYKAVLTDADMTNANLEDALFDDAQLSGVKGYKENLLLMEGN